MDPLSDVLSLLQPSAAVAGGFDVGGAFSIGFDRFSGIKCYALVSGACWLCIEGAAQPVWLAAGDCFLLPSGRPFHLTNDMRLMPVAAAAYFGTTRGGGVAVINGGGAMFVAGGHFSLSGGDACMLLGVLPPVVHIREEADRAALRWCLDRMRQEMRAQLPGGYLVMQHLAHMMLVQALRLHLGEGAKGGVGWLFALADKRIAAAIGAMHEAPARRWTLEALAACAGMSRSTFALRFKEMVGEPPLEYLTKWRMRLAADRLGKTDDAVSGVARGLGYESESAFSTAFKRVMGCSPRQYRGGRDVVVAKEAA